MFYYLLADQVLLSATEYKDLPSISEEEARARDGIVNILTQRDPARFRRSFCVSDPSLAFIAEEGLALLQRDNRSPQEGNFLPPWVVAKIEKRQVRLLNTAYPSWQKVLKEAKPPRWRVNILGLGDVGSTLAIGLRLLGGDCISQIGIFARRKNQVQRWEQELNQIRSAQGGEYPEVREIGREQLFDCDLFVFCASTGVPPVGKEGKDVRMAQFTGNAQLVKEYALLARERGFSGIFAVISDPVDLLCRVAFLASNQEPGSGAMDYRGLAPEQVRGYGLGVMHARACYYALQDEKTKHYVTEGRAFGPHGRGLVIADSITNYNDALSRELTEKTIQANLRIRDLGFKPYIAPALSSGTLSLLATIKGEWHYSATFMGGVFFGAKNRLLPTGVELERNDLPPALRERLAATYNELQVIL